MSLPSEAPDDVIGSFLYNFSGPLVESVATFGLGLLIAIPAYFRQKYKKKHEWAKHVEVVAQRLERET